MPFYGNFLAKLVACDEPLTSSESILTACGMPKYVVPLRADTLSHAPFFAVDTRAFAGAVPKYAGDI